MVIALPVAGAILVALIAVVILLGAPAFKHLFNETVGKLPVVGGYISGILSSALDVTTSALVSWAQGAGSAVADAASGLIGHLWSVDSYATDAIGAVTAALGRLSTRLWNTGNSLAAQITSTAATLSGAILWWVATLRAEAAALEKRVDGAILWWVGQLQGAISSAVSTAEGLFNRAEADASAAATAAESAAVGAAQSLFHQAETDLTAATAATMGAITALGATVATEIAGAEQHAIDVAATLASAAAAGAVDALDSAAHDLVLGPWLALLPDLEAIVTNLGADATAAIPGLSTIPRDLPLTLPAILGVLAPTVAATVTEVGECLAPNCNPLKRFGSLFNALEDTAFLGLLFAMLSEAHTNPEGLAHAMESDLSGFAHGVSDTFRSLVGV